MCIRDRAAAWPRVRARVAAKSDMETSDQSLAPREPLVEEPARSSTSCNAEEREARDPRSRKPSSARERGPEGEERDVRRRADACTPPRPDRREVAGERATERHHHERAADDERRRRREILRDDGAVAAH